MIACLLALAALLSAATERSFAQEWSITKTANPTTYQAAGVTITYTYVVTKLIAGPDTNLQDIAITDDRLGTICTGRSITGDAAGGTTTCTANYTTTAADLTVASITNTATANGTISSDMVDLPTITAQATITNTATPSWTLSKATNPSTYNAAGQTINYTYVLTNTGNLSISAIALTDDRVATVNCPATTLAAGANMTCTGSYTTTAADVGTGSITNVATANGTPAFGTLAAVTAQATVTNTASASWTLAKTASPSTYGAAGQTISYTYVLTNTGSLAISAIALTDNRVASVNCPATTLAAGANMSCTGSYTTTAADVAAGSITNVATANGTPAFGTLAAVIAQATVRNVTVLGSITIVKIANGRDQTFAFTSSVPSAGSFSLTTANGSATRTFTGLAAGTYTFAETNLPLNWRLTALTCSGDTGGAATTTNLSARTISIGLDGGEAITCTFTNTFDTTEHILRTQAVIFGFLSRRVQLLASNEPDRPRFLRRMPGSLWGDAEPNNGATPTEPFTFAGTSAATGSRMAFATSLSQAQAYAKAKSDDALGATGSRKGIRSGKPDTSRFDAWIEASFNHFTSGADGFRNRGHFNIVYLGADYLLTQAVLLGALVQFDWMGETSRTLNSAASGRGFMAGPYVSVRLTPHLLFDARAAWGASNNDVNPFGLYQDGFATDRWLAHANLTGNWWMGNFRVTPSAGVTFIEEQQQSYIDSLGVTIPAQTVSLGRLTVGPELAYRFAGSDGATYEPHVQLRGAWDFIKPDATFVNGTIISSDVLRAQVQGGVLTRLPSGISLRVSGQYDGIGSSTLRSYGGNVWLNVPFSLLLR